MGVTGRSVIMWPSIYVMLVSKSRLIMCVYGCDRAEFDKVAQHLCDAGIKAEAYHVGVWV